MTRKFKMTSFHSLRQGLLLTALVTPLMVGCGGSPSPSDSGETPAAEGTPAASSGAGVGTAAPAATIVTDGAETEAATSVAVFLDSLRRGNEDAANGVLTAKAREELAKTEYVIQPLGTPDGNYQIGRVGFPYPEKTVALVECLWQEPAIGAQPSVAMDIVCEVHQEPEGWRIAGIAVTIPDSLETIVLDFEDAASLQATIDAATGRAPEQQVATDTRGLPAQTVAAQVQPYAQPAPQYQQPQQPSGVTIQMQTGNNSLPALPQGLPQQNVDTYNGSNPPQLALPPLPGAPLQR